MKICNKCGIEKHPDEFHVDLWKKDGRHGTCQLCKTKRNRADWENYKEEKMNKNKFESIARGLTTQAAKVYDCIPINESWDSSQIMGELRRKNCSISDFNVVKGCVNSLIESGLVKEQVKGRFRREIVRPSFEAQKNLIENDIKESVMAQTSTENTLTKSSGALDRLSEFASRLRVLAKDMDDAAIELAVQAEKNENETAKMRQLQAILKSLG